VGMNRSNRANFFQEAILSRVAREKSLLERN
jgi:hypothetical protein